MAGEAGFIQALADKDARPDQHGNLTYTESGTRRALDTVLVGGSAAAGGQSGPAKIIAVTLSSGSATNLNDALTAAGLTAFNAINIQNYSGIEIEVAYTSLWTYGTGSTTAAGWAVRDGENFYRDITNGITVYAKSASGTPVIKVEGITNT